MNATMPGGSVGFHVPCAEGGDCYVEVDVSAVLIDWYAGRFESEHGRPLTPAPNVFVSWTVSGAMDLKLMHEIAEALTPGEVATAWDDIDGFGVEFAP